METYEFQGKTADDAILNACRALNKDKDAMEIEILEPGSPGIFGLMGGRKAKIRVHIPGKELETETIPQAELPTAEEEVTPISDGLVATVDEPSVIVDEQAVLTSKDALENILRLIPVEGATVRASQINGIISLEIDGDKSGLLIGRKGRTLDAIQFVVNKIVNKSLEKRIQVVVDSERYRGRRKDFLTQMALQMGAKAKKLKKPMTTNLLYPQDRRIVHLALRDDTELSTKSRGDGLFKKVVIIPKV
jgi:spoIIIJ-associated protein